MYVGIINFILHNFILPNFSPDIMSQDGAVWNKNCFWRGFWQLTDKLDHLSSSKLKS